MVLCTSYGLLIYECQIQPVASESGGSSTKKKSQKSGREEGGGVEGSSEKTSQEESKSAKKMSKSRESDKPKITVSAIYKLSVLPDERVVDCISFNTS